MQCRILSCMASICPLQISEVVDSASSFGVLGQKVAFLLFWGNAFFPLKPEITIMSNGPPPPFGLQRPSRSDKRYRLVVVQHPVRARCFGFGEKDRRLVDPPPVLQIFAEQGNNEIVSVSPDDSKLFLVQCDLHSKDRKENRSVVYVPSSIPTSQSLAAGGMSSVISLRQPTIVRNLTGSVISSAYHLLNEKNEPGVYFVFPDLSVRTEGCFTLRFMFMDLVAGDPFTMSTSVQSEIFSDSFTVYSAKKFPGMTESTALSKTFAKQGVKISVRKDMTCKRVMERELSPESDRPDQMSPDILNSSGQFFTAVDEDDNDQNNQEGQVDSISSPAPYRRISISQVLSRPEDDD